MQDRPDIDERSAIWAATDAVLTGRLGDWETVLASAPPDQQSLMQELKLIAGVIAACEERQGTPSDKRSPIPDDLEGQSWGPLVILEQVGTGAFGDVYRAQEPSLDRQVALKFFRPTG